MFSKVALQFFVASAALLIGMGCSGRNIHVGQDADNRILLREWTRITHDGIVEAGEHSAEHSNAVFFDNTLEEFFNISFHFVP